MHRMPFYSTHVWETGLEKTGRVEIKTDMSVRSWWFLIPVVVIVGVMAVIGYSIGAYDPVALIIGLIVFAVLGISVLYLMVFRHRNKALIVDHDSLTLIDGFRLEWPEVERVELISTGGKSGSGFTIEVNRSAWNRYLQHQGPEGRLNSQLNKSVYGRQAILLSAIYGPNPHELAIWLNGFTVAGREEKETETF